jgi:hypothetical protein
MKRNFYVLLKNFTCDGVAASSIHNCITDQGQVCSDAGSCVENACLCDSGREGKYCEDFKSDSSDTEALTIGLGTVAHHHTLNRTHRTRTSHIAHAQQTKRSVRSGVGIPVVSLAFVGLLVFIVVLLVLVQRKGKGNDNWEIRYDELEVGEHLGTGGFGEVHRATWKGTEVAVKVMASDRITKEMEKSFKDEVRLRDHLVTPIASG